MARYLTPGKLSTLILIELHFLSDEAFCFRLLDVVSSQVLPTSHAAKSLDALHEDFTKTSDITRLGSVLQKLPSDLPGRTAFDYFLSQAWACADLDSLHDLFDRLHRIAHPVQAEDRRVSPASPIGQFLRRCLVEWTRLQFADSLAILEAFRRWLQPTHARLLRIDPERAARVAGSDALSGNTPSVSVSRELSVSSEDVEAALTHSIFVLQRIGQRMSTGLKHEITSWARQMSSQSLVHFMAFYESWRAGEYTMALENLHRYFDYSLSASRGAEDASGPRVQYQYALLHLSVLHADFDRWQECVESMEECVITGTIQPSRPWKSDCLIADLVQQLAKIKIHLACFSPFPTFCIFGRFIPLHRLDPYPPSLRSPVTVVARTSLHSSSSKLVRAGITRSLLRLCLRKHGSTCGVLGIHRKVSNAYYKPHISPLCTLYTIWRLASLHLKQASQIALVNNV